MGKNVEALARTHPDITDGKKAELKTVMARCAKDFDFPLAKPYDLEHDNFKYFALCLRNNLVINPILNGSAGLRKSVLDYHY